MTTPKRPNIVANLANDSTTPCPAALPTNSCNFAVIAAQESTKPFVTFDHGIGPPRRRRPFSCSIRIRFSAARYSFRRDNSSSTVPVMYANTFRQSINATSSLPETTEDFTARWETGLSSGCEY